MLDGDQLEGHGVNGTSPGPEPKPAYTPTDCPHRFGGREIEICQNYPIHWRHSTTKGPLGGLWRICESNMLADLH